MLKAISDFLHKLPKREKKITLATKVTLLRGLLVPFLVLSMIFQQWNYAFWLFLTAAFSDILDGGIARFRNEQTILGACLDPIIDKFLILSVYFTFAFITTPLFQLPKWFFILVLAKEILLIFGVVLFFYKKGVFRIQPTLLGKAAMAFQVVFILWLFSCYFFHWLPVKTYYVMQIAVLTLVGGSFIQYLCIGIQRKRTL